MYEILVNAPYQNSSEIRWWLYDLLFGVKIGLDEVLPRAITLDHRRL
jgi:hypothetical protein